MLVFVSSRAVDEAVAVLDGGDDHGLRLAGLGRLKGPEAQDGHIKTGTEFDGV